MKLNLEGLKNAIDSLDRSLTVEKSLSNTCEKPLLETVRAGIIQNFEVAYEQAWKLIQRWIRENKTLEEAENPRTRRELFRLAAKFGLISDPIHWFEYGDARNLTSHTYDCKQAQIVYEAAKNFLNDANILLRNLINSND